MIKDQLKIHSRQSFELKLELPAKDMLSGNPDFGVDMYLFLPPALDVNKHNFTKSDFYQSLKTYIRLRKPFYHLAAFCSRDTDAFANLNQEWQEYLKYPGAKQEQHLKRELKNYAANSIKSLQREMKAVLQNKKHKQNVKKILGFIDASRQMRSMLSKITKEAKQNAWDKNILSAFNFADEYQSLMLERQLHLLMNALEARQILDEPVMEAINILAINELRYRESVKYPSVCRPNQENEGVLHRRARLKRYIESNLFLNTDTRKEGVFYEQLLFSLAAGLAMVFATGIAFVSQKAFGNLSLPFFIALVISYMFKDRIKELARMYFDKKRRRMFFDFKTNISFQKNEIIGCLKESFRFEKPQMLPDEVLLAREQMRATEIGEEWPADKVIHYRTKIRVKAKKIIKLNDFNGITQILRLNITPFCYKMDDHDKEIFVQTGKKLKRRRINRVYHLNLLLYFRNADEKSIKFYKFVTDKQGIRKIQKIPLDLS